MKNRSFQRFYPSDELHRFPLFRVFVVETSKLNKCNKLTSLDYFEKRPDKFNTENIESEALLGSHSS